VRVDDRGPDIGMTEQRLDRADKVVNISRGSPESIEAISVSPAADSQVWNLSPSRY
jgi:hypothetical protein